MTTLAIKGLAPADIRALNRHARENGLTPSEYARSLIEKELSFADRSFDEILRPVREGFRKNGMTEEAFDKLVTRARHARSKKIRGRRK